MPHHSACRLLLFACLLLCGLAALPGIARSAPDAAISYRETIQPLFDRKCLACHACYDAPCQLKLDSGDGAVRGATRLKVYDSERIKTQTPTRLFTDAFGEDAWRRKGFSSVLQPQADGTEPLMARMLELGRQQHFTPGAKLPDDIPIGINADYQCPVNAAAMDRFVKKFPHRGMPLGVTGLTDDEYRSVRRWLADGAPVDAEPVRATAAEAAQVADWEAFLNRKGQREQLVSRWLYEHLFLAHLYFEDIADSHFFELVRSRTPSGRPIDLIATAQPNDAPGGPVYYRLRPLQGTIVRKTHITYPLSPEKLKHIETLFFDSDWQLKKSPGYEEAARSNPFTTFAAIPALARYQFMLDNAEYFVRTFIRGPVCRGSIATDVIRDQFWVFFQDPDHDLYITSAAHRAQATPLLGLPGQRSGLSDLVTQWARYTYLRNRYTTLRTRDYARTEPAGASLDDIWDGDGHNRDALLTIVRHHDSASVVRGLWGEIPQTLWWMDYPLLERTYYSLVVNFNVFDTVSHQGQTRLYFDLIRHGAETSFLRLMPPAARESLIHGWYQDSGLLKVWLYYPKTDTRQPVAIPYRSDDPKTEFAQLLQQRFAPLLTPDPINRCGSDHCYRPDAPVFARVADQTLSHLASRPAAQLPVVKFLPEATLLRVYTAQGQREIYTLLRNRAHSNVAYMAAESLRYRPEKDTLMVYAGILTSYPNFAFNVPAEEITAFSAAMQAVKDADDFERIVQRWGVRRTHPDFWEIFQDYTAYMREREPREAGVLDIDRYENL